VVLLPDAAAGPDEATFTVVAGLADVTCYSLRVADGRYVRHSSFRLVLGTDSDPLFRVDATFCPRRGSGADEIRLQSFNYRDRYVHHRGDEVWLDPGQNTERFLAESTFIVAPPR
jgi:hypothetical protein